MPTNFGRIFRVGISSNRNNPMATVLHVLSRDRHGKLVTTPDTLKKNIRKYINDFRLISDAIDCTKKFRPDLTSCPAMPELSDVTFGSLLFLPK